MSIFCQNGNSNHQLLVFFFYLHCSFIITHWTINEMTPDTATLHPSHFHFLLRQSLGHASCHLFDFISQLTDDAYRAK